MGSGVYHLAGAGLLVLALLVAGPGRLSFAITRRRRRFGATPARARGAVPILLAGAGAGLLAAGGFDLDPVVAAVQGAVFGLLLYYVARLADFIWPLALLLVAVFYAPLWHLMDLCTRLLLTLLRTGTEHLPALLQEAFFFHRAYWPNREGIVEVLGFPPLWFIAPALLAVFFAWARARGVRG